MIFAMRPPFRLCAILLTSIQFVAVAASTVRVHPAPSGEALCTNYSVQVDGKSVPICIAKVAPADPQRRWKAMDDKARSADYFETASFGYFDMEGNQTISVTCPADVRSAKVLPSSYGIKPVTNGRKVTFTLDQPRHVTLEVNDRWTGALHLFANPPEEDVPAPTDPNVIYFGPGIHEISHLVVTNNQTVYVAGGAVVRCVISPDEPHWVSSYSGLKNYAPSIVLRGDNIRLRGRGIIDGSACTTHAKNLVLVQGRNISLEGVILRDSSTWTVPVRRSENVRINNLKLIGYRANSDGIDICNSSDVTVEDCFIRTLDDLIVIKTDKGHGPAQRITARRCVLWNEVAHALSIGAELRENVSDVLFEDCDVIHDFGREWTLRVYHCDSSRISNIRFENLRIEESPRLFSLWINKAVWTRDAERGHIDGVLFKNIRAASASPKIELLGYDEAHAIENVTFEKVMINGQPLTPAAVKTNAFVRQLSFRAN